MKKIKNTSLQGLTLIFETPSGSLHKFARPGEIVSVPDNWVSKQNLNLHKRRLVKIINA